jgi:uncharacterized DUF497 family protein
VATYIHAYIAAVRFAWDHSKSERNLAERGFDFAFATLIFDGATLERLDTRRDYGEPRTVAVGAADGVLLTVVYTDRPAPEGGAPVRAASSPPA